MKFNGFTKFDKAFAGGFAAWATQGVVAAIEAVGLPPVPVAMETWLATLVGLLAVYFMPNKAVPSAPVVETKKKKVDTK